MHIVRTDVRPAHVIETVPRSRLGQRPGGDSSNNNNIHNKLSQSTLILPRGEQEMLDNLELDVFHVLWTAKVAVRLSHRLRRVSAEVRTCLQQPHRLGGARRLSRLARRWILSNLVQITIDSRRRSRGSMPDQPPSRLLMPQRRLPKWPLTQPCRPPRPHRWPR